MSEIITKYATLKQGRNARSRRRRNYDNKKSLEAVITSYGNRDVVNDVIVKGALDGFMDNFNGELPMMLQHDQSKIIGVWTDIYEDGNTVVAEGVLNDTSVAKDVSMLLDEGMYKDVSIGFRGNSYEFNEFGGRDFKQIDIFETSVVFAGANPKAAITSVKDEDGIIDARKVEDALRDVGLTQTERKLLLAGGIKQLMKQRDVLSVEHQKLDLINKLRGLS